MFGKASERAVTSGNGLLGSTKLAPTRVFRVPSGFVRPSYDNKLEVQVGSSKAVLARMKPIRTAPTVVRVLAAAIL